MNEELDNSISKKKDIWDKLKIIASSISLLIIPILLGIITYNIQSSLKQKDVQIRFVELAIKVLSEKPNDSSKDLRRWATDILDRYSGVALGPARDKLINQDSLPKSWEELGLPNPNKPISMKIENPDEIVRAKDLCDLRCKNEVQGVYESPHDYRTIKLSGLPSGKYAWVTAGDLKLKEDMLLVATGWGSANIEVHKNSEGKVFIVGYADINRVQPKKILLFPVRPPNSFSLEVVAIPIDIVEEIE